jgi:hypothetical protein
MTYRCSCGFSTTSLERFEDHLFTFPEDDHYGLASGHQDCQDTILTCGGGPGERVPAALAGGLGLMDREGGFAGVDDCPGPARTAGSPRADSLPGAAGSASAAGPEPVRRL